MIGVKLILFVGWSVLNSHLLCDGVELTLFVVRVDQNDVCPGIRMIVRVDLFDSHGSIIRKVIEKWYQNSTFRGYLKVYVDLCRHDVLHYLKNVQLWGGIARAIRVCMYLWWFTNFLFSCFTYNYETTRYEEDSTVRKRLSPQINRTISWRTAQSFNDIKLRRLGHPRYVVGRCSKTT